MAKFRIAGKDYKLDTYQKRVIDDIASGDSLFITGKAGTGKTHVLKIIKEIYGGKKVVAVLAPTGVAARNAGGFTMHSFFRLPVGTPYLPDHELKPDLYQLSDISAKTLCSIDILVIDEISMVRCDMLDATDDILRHYRRNKQPFGGVQLVMFGDLYQLCPVTQQKEKKTLLDYYHDGFYFFFSHALRELDYKVVELQKIHRQDNRVFINLLNNIRIGDVNIKNLALLNTRVEPDYYPLVTDSIVTLMTHNYQTKKRNKEMYRLLTTKEYPYKAVIEYITDKWREKYPVEFNLRLKVGARVMFQKNDTENDEYANGTMGWVVALTKDMVYVKRDDNIVVCVNKATWEQKDYIVDKKTKTIYTETSATFSQIPLKLAWAVSIHKSQGLTFKEVAIDASKSFTYGQVYVALSRCTTLEGIHLLKSIPSHKIIADEVVKTYMDSIGENGYVEPIDEFETEELEEKPLELNVSSSVFFNIKKGIKRKYKHTIYDNDYARKLLLHKGNKVCINKIYSSVKKKWSYWDINGGNFPFIMRQYKKALFSCSEYGLKLEAEIDGKIEPYKAVDPDGYDTWAFRFRIGKVRKA